MSRLRILTAGESHGKGLTGIIEGIPSGLSLCTADIDRDLERRQKGYGRGGRMKIEKDTVRIISGVRWGKTLGSPVSLAIQNRDWKNWENGMSVDAVHTDSIPPVTKPRPGHADLAGVLKYGHRDIRNILERSSARETAMRTALGAVARTFLSSFGIMIRSYVVRIGSVSFEGSVPSFSSDPLFDRAEASPVRCPDLEAERAMIYLIDHAAEKGDSLGGVFIVFIDGLPIGLGSHIQWDRRLDGRIAQAMMSIPAIKGVGIGAGFQAAEQFGSEVMDVFEAHGEDSGDFSRFLRASNNAGGIEGGMTNGMPVVIQCAMKPIPTLRSPLRSYDILTGEISSAAYERSDVCAVPAAAVIGEAMAALVIADAFLEKFSGDSMDETGRNYASYQSAVASF